MYIKWTSHLQDQEDKKSFEQNIRGARSVLERLKDILDEEEKGLDRSEMDIRTFDLPNWANRQAYKNGYRSALSNLKKLVDLDQQKDTK